MISEAIKERAKRELAKRHLEDFLLYDGRGNWQTARHLKVLIDVLEGVEANVRSGKGDRVIICMPPRHGKSEVSSKKYPAWVLGRNPEWELIITSYSADLAYDFSKIARNTFAEHAPELFDLNLAKDSGAVGRWGVEGHRGGIAAAGAGGPLTGRGAHVAIIDDPFKGSKDADSKTIRDNIWDWYRSVLRTRLAPGGAIILIMTRWHEDDLAGKLIKEMKQGTGEDWRVVSMPAVAEGKDDMLGRPEGEVLWPDRFSPDEYEAMKISVGSRMWNSLYLQRPSPAGGAIFKRHWINFYVPTQEIKAKFGLNDDVVVLPRLLDYQAQSWDCAFKDKDSSDPVSGQIWAKKKANFYLVDRLNERLSFVKTLKAIKQMTAKHPNARAKYIEDKANGSAVISMFENEIPGIIPIEPDGGKEVRANAVSPLFEAGNVYFPHPCVAPWVEGMIEEFVSFPNGEHDDDVDATTQALNKMSGSKTSLLDRYKNMM